MGSVTLKLFSIALILTSASHVLATSVDTNITNLEINYDDTLDTNFTTIKAGTFFMGSPLTEFERFTYEVLHAVNITKDYEIQQTELTQQQWFKIMGNNPSHFSRKTHCPTSHDIVGNIEMCSNHPVENVSWEDIQIFIEGLNSESNDYTYRLPTEAEWEMASRGQTQTAFSFGNEVELLNQYGWYSANSQRQTHAVKSKNPNQFVLFDMHGNVWEWVQDWYTIHNSSLELTDPKGPQHGHYRVIKGGSWKQNSTFARSAAVFSSHPETTSKAIGFRLVRTKK